MIKVRFNFSYRLIIGALLLISLILAIGFISIAYIYRLQDKTTQIMNQNLESLKAARELEIILFHMRGLTFNYLLDKQPKWLTQLDDREKEFINSLDKARKTANTQEEINLVQQISVLFSNYEQDLKTAQIMYKQGQISRSNALLLHASRNLFDTIYEKCKSFIATNETARSVYEQQIKRVNDTIRTVMYVLGIGGILLGAMLGWIISRIILNPIKDLVTKIRGAVEGSSSDQIHISPGRELRELDQHLYLMSKNIHSAQAELEKNRLLLERSNRLAALGKISTAIAHELRNPLTALQMLIYSIKNDPDITKKYESEIEVMFKEINRMNSFIKNFLNFAKPAEPKPVPVDLAEIIRETLLLLGPRLRQNNIDCLEKLTKDKITLLTDPDQFKQVLINIILNAIDAMPNGGRITIESSIISPVSDSLFLQIKISDTGKGISDNLIETLFDPFVKGREDGLGLGLSISHQIITLQGGWITATNNEQGGASFTVQLPYMREISHE
ncbi:MAG: MCP four helix bundle domain-containing protein [bacterium]|nr:MAG: MCP four helix bundle domain-containing protein [bacterium]